MMPENDPTVTLANGNAIISFAAGLLTLVSLCVAVIPIPFTGYVCFPAAAVLGAVAVVSGLRSIHQTRSTGTKGSTLAAAGMGMGGLAMLASLCIAVLGITLWSRLAEALRLLAH